MRLGPAHSALDTPGWNVWCPTAIPWQGRWWLFHSRWPKALGHDAWVTHSTVAVAVADGPEGPFTEEIEILAGRPGAWDSGAIHNPMVMFRDGLFWLYYMGNCGGAQPGQVADQETWWEHRNHQQIGVAWSTHPHGPWTRAIDPIVGPANTPVPTLMASNPAVAWDLRGGVRMVYKCVEPGTMPFGGRVIHLVAEAPDPRGPFTSLPTPVLTAPGVQFPAEDPFLWHDEAGWNIICKDMRGSFSGCGTALVHFTSQDGRAWMPASAPVLSGLTIQLMDGNRRRVERLERPSLSSDRRWFFAACLDGPRQCILSFPFHASQELAPMSSQNPAQLAPLTKLSDMARNEIEQAEMLGQAQHSRPSDAGELPHRNGHPDAQWFNAAPLGLFIHWGISAVHGTLDLSWGMIANMGNGSKLTPRQYWELAKDFRAEAFRPRELLAQVKAAGFDYAVLTVKHHDGFALWDTGLCNLGVRQTLGGRDLVREFVVAAREAGLKVGLFFSGMDWHFDQHCRSFNYRSQSGRGSSSLEPIPGRADFGIDHEPRVPEPVTDAFRQRYAAWNRAQLIELLTRYGCIDMLWYDGGGGDGITIEEIRGLQPGIVVNNRGHTMRLSNCQPSGGLGVFPGDFKTFEGAEKFPESRPSGWWEENLVWNEPYWGYHRENETTYAPLTKMLALYVQARAWGGAYLMNVGPRPDGSLPAPFHRGLAELAAWRTANLEALEGTIAQPHDVVTNRPLTVGALAWYVWAMPAQGGEIQVSGGGHDKPPRQVERLDGTPVSFTWVDGTVVIRGAALADLPYAIALRWD